VKMPQDAQEVVRRLLADAHVDGRPSREIAETFLASLEDLDRFGQQWTDDLRRELAIRGAMKVCGDYRRRQVTHHKTPKGKSITMPRYAGINRGVHVQVEFSGLTVEELRSHLLGLVSQRDALSVRISFVSHLLKQMRDGSTAGQAAERLERAS